MLMTMKHVQTEVKDEYGINLIDEIKEKYDGILLAVAHNKFAEIDILIFEERSR